MSKITELGRIVGANTKSRDLFVVVNLDQGEDGTKNITRRELVQAIQQEAFDNILITGGNIFDVNITDADITINTPYDEPLGENSYFYVKDIIEDKTVALSFNNFQKELARKLKKITKIYVATDGSDVTGNGSYLRPYATLEAAFTAHNLITTPVSITVLPGTYFTNGNLALRDECTLVSTNGQYATKFVMNPGYTKVNCVLVGSGCYVQGFSFENLQIDNYDEPTVGFAIAFRPGATILRSPYIRDCSQISNYFRTQVVPPLNPQNSKGEIFDLGIKLTLSGITGAFVLGNAVTASGGATGFLSRITEIGSNVVYVRNSILPFGVGETITTSSGGTATITAVGDDDFPNALVGRGGGMLLADRAVLNQDSIFPYMLAFGATPRSQNGIGYVAKNGAGINGISSMSIFQRCSFYALRGGQITLNNSGTQFGDISMRATGSTPVLIPATTNETLIVSTALAEAIDENRTTIVDSMWISLVAAGYVVNETLTKRDAGNWLRSVANDFRLGRQRQTRIFAAGLFDYKGDYVFNPTTSVGAGTLLNAFLASFDFMKTSIQALTTTGGELAMLDGLVDDVTKGTLSSPSTLNFGSLIESIAHQFNLAGAGVHQNALPLNFRRLGRPVSASGSVLQENGGRVRWSGADELNNQFFAKGLRINGRNGRIEGRPFTSSVRRLARRAANSRI